MVEYLARALRQTSREATILLYSPALDPHLQKITELADLVFCIYGEQAKGRKAETKIFNVVHCADLARNLYITSLPGHSSPTSKPCRMLFSLLITKSMTARPRKSMTPPSSRRSS